MSEDTKLVDAINRVRAERKRLVMENAILREALDRIANDETDYPKQVAKEALQEKNNFPVEPKELHANGEDTQDELDAAAEAEVLFAAAYAADAAAWATAWYAARAAAWAVTRSAAGAYATEAAAWAKQEAELRRICGEIEVALADFGQTYKKLTDLLCRIHRDGGQAIGKYGVDKAYVDAVEIVLQTFDRAEKAESELARYKQGVEVEDFVNHYGVLEAEFELRPDLWGKRVRVLVMKEEE